jgi:rRNA small subunit pseudouridine methyltransferase Nep1
LLSLVLAESAVELIPREISSHPAVRAWSRRKGKPAGELILDQNYHHAAIHRLARMAERRGRPDIAHYCLLLALGSPLNIEGHLRCYVHTIDEKVITVNQKTRLPRQSDRFVSLLEQLFATRVVPTEGEPLLSLRDSRLAEIIREVKGDYVVALSLQGEPRSMENVATQMIGHEHPVLLVGGFSTGHFSKETLALANDVFQIYPKSLEAWTVVSRALYDYERAVVRARIGD